MREGKENRPLTEVRPPKAESPQERPVESGTPSGSVENDLSSVPGVPGSELPAVVAKTTASDRAVASEVAAAIAAGNFDDATRVAQTTVEKPPAEKYREALLSGARESAARHGYALTTDAPFKSFGERERFFIQRAKDAEGGDVVVKISAPESGPNRALGKETSILRAVSTSLEHAVASGKDVHIGIPRPKDEWSEGGERGLVTEFVSDDKEAKRAMPATERGRILKTVIEGLQSLKVPPGLQEAGVRPLDAAAHAEKAERALEKVADSLTAEEAESVKEAFRAHSGIIDSFPMKIAHGDLHAENIAYGRDADGKERLTVMDLEAVRATNEFFDWATTANLASFGPYVEKLPPGKVRETLGTSWIDKESGQLESFVEDQVTSHARGQDAETVYRLMRIQNALEKLGNAKGSDPLAAITREATSDIIRNQLAKLKRSPQSGA